MGTSDIADLAVTVRRLPVRASGAGTPPGRSLPASSGAARAEAAADDAAVRAMGGLVPALRALPRELACAGCLVEVRVRGRARHVDRARAEALLRAARAAVASAVRRGRASVVVVTFVPERAAVVVRDDGVALAARPGDDAFRLRLLRKTLAALGGGLEISHGRRGGVIVRAWTGLSPG